LTTLTSEQIEKKIKYLLGKHRELDKIIEHNESSSSPNAWREIKNLKKQKLTLKDEITVLENEKNKIQS
jgi:uncharacterized protein YdcH (DUF465 family)